MANVLSLQTIADHLSAICGAEHSRADDEFFHVFPANTEEISVLLRYANENHLTVTPYGGGTKRTWGNVTQATLIVHTFRMNRVLEHTWQDMTCTVQAGCIWTSLQSVLARYGQFVALDPIWAGQATIGGVVATNDSGSLRLKYGSLRDLIIGMTIVLADGTIARTGGKVVKNVAGYDLHKLMTGAFGTLGIITEVTFRLHSIPRQSQSFSISSADAFPLGQLLMKLLDSHFSTQSLQFRSSREGFYLDLELTALPEIIEDQAKALSTLARSLDLTVDNVGPDVWMARQEHSGRTASFVIKATMLPSDIARLAEAVRLLSGTSVTQAMGIMTACIPADCSDMILKLRRQLDAAGGSLTVLHEPEEKIIDTWSLPVDTLPLMREIKRRFDPHGILNPGSFVGGI